MPRYPRITNFARLSGTAAAALLCAGCALPGPQFSTQPPTDIKREQTIGLDEKDLDSGVTDYETTYGVDDVFVIKKSRFGDTLPDIALTNVNLNEQSVAETMNSVLAGTDIALVSKGGRKGDADVYGSVTLTNLSGSLTKVLETISQNIGFFYSYNAKQKVLTLSPNRDFVIFLPPAVGSDTYTGMTNTMESLGVHSVYQDVNNRTLKFTANRDALEKVEEYLAQIRATRSLLIYDISIYSVQLTNSFAAGIAWSQIANKSGGALVGGATLANGIQASFNLSKIGLAQNVIPSLLQSYGKVKSVANPRLTFLSGGSGYFRQGQDTTYVSKIGNNYGVSVNTVTVETADIKTGTEMAITADVADGTIYTRIKLKTSSIISNTSYTALGTQLTLPTTGDNEVNAEVRSRIGDGILLGGIIIDTASNDMGGIPGTTDSSLSVPISRNDAKTRSELVLVLRPHLVRFAVKGDKVAPSPSAVAKPDVSPVVALPVAIAFNALPAVTVATAPVPVPAPAPAPVVAPMPSVKDVPVTAASPVPAAQAPQKPSSVPPPILITPTPPLVVATVPAAVVQAPIVVPAPAPAVVVAAPQLQNIPKVSAPLPAVVPVASSPVVAVAPPAVVAPPAAKPVAASPVIETHANVIPVPQVTAPLPIPVIPVKMAPLASVSSASVASFSPPAAVVALPASMAAVRTESKRTVVSDAPFLAVRGQSVKTALTQWGAQTGRKLIWSAVGNPSISIGFSEVELPNALAAMSKDLRLSDASLYGMFVMVAGDGALVVSDFAN